MVVTYPLGGYTVTEYSRVSDHVLIEARPWGQPGGWDCDPSAN